MGNYYNKPSVTSVTIQSKVERQVGYSTFQGNLQFKEEMGTRRCKIK